MPRGGAVTAAVVALGVSMVTMAQLDRASAQQAETELPGITVEGGGAKKKSAAKKSAAPAPAPAAAEPAASVDSEAARLDAPYDTPAGVSVVGESEINTFGQVRLDNVMRTIPGTYTRESTNNPGMAVNIRGFEGSGRVNTTIDGARQNFRFTGHEAQGFVYVDPNLLAGIDVARGAVSTAGGAGALAGTADFRTLDVGDILKPGQDMGALTQVTWGSNGLGWSEMAAGAVTNGRVGFAGAFSKHDEHDYENGDGETVPFTFEDLTSGLFKANFALNEEMSLRFGGVFYDNDFLANSYFQHLKSNTYTAKYAYKPKDNDLIDLRVNGYRTDLSMRYGTDFDPTSAPPFPPGQPLIGSAAGRVIEDEGWGADISNTSRTRVGSVGVRSTYGYEYFFDDVQSYNKLNPNSGGGVNPSGKNSVGGFFSETSFSLGMFELIGGLRYDTYQLEGTFNAKAGNPMGVPVGDYDLDRDGGRWNPKVTLAATPLDWFQPYVTYSESLRAPTIFETMAGGSHPGGGTSFAPNPFLEPEIQKGWEVGANFKKDGLFTRSDMARVKVDYYRMEVENYVTACFTTSAFFCNAEGISVVDGVEAQATYDAGFVFGGVSYTYTRTTLPSQINGFGAFSYLPDHVLTLTGGLRFLQERLTVGGRVYVVSEGYTGSDIIPPPLTGSNGPTFTDPYELLDFFSSYKVTDDWELGLTVTNVFDRAYSPALNTPGTDFTGETGRGRTFLLTTRAQF